MNRTITTGLFVALLILCVGCGCKSKQAKTQAVIETLVGNDSDDHGCKGSAGYQWSEMNQKCIRIWEEGIAVFAPRDSTSAAYIVLAPDSTKLELFMPSGKVILDRRQLPSGRSTWNIEDDDTQNVTIENGKWEVSQRGKLIYKEKMGAAQ